MNLIEQDRTRRDRPAHRHDKSIDFRAGDTVAVIKAMKATAAAADLRRRGHRPPQPRPQLLLHRAQDLLRRGRGAHVPALLAAGRIDPGRAPRRRAPTPSSTTCASAADKSARIKEKIVRKTQESAAQ